MIEEIKKSIKTQTSVQSNQKKMSKCIVQVFLVSAPVLVMDKFEIIWGNKGVLVFGKHDRLYLEIMF